MRRGAWIAAIIVGGAAILAVAIVVGISVWASVKHENAKDRADEASAEVASLIAEKIGHTRTESEIVDAVNASGGVFVRREQESGRSVIIVRVRAIDTGIGGDPMQSERCYKFAVPQASQRKVAYWPIHLDRCVDWTVPPGPPPGSGRPHGPR